MRVAPQIRSHSEYGNEVYSSGKGIRTQAICTGAHRHLSSLKVKLISAQRVTGASSWGASGSLRWTAIQEAVNARNPKRYGLSFVLPYSF